MSVSRFRRKLAAARPFGSALALSGAPPPDWWSCLFLITSQIKYHARNVEIGPTVSRLQQQQVQELHQRWDNDFTTHAVDSLLFWLCHQRSHVCVYQKLHAEQSDCSASWPFWGFAKLNNRYYTVTNLILQISQFERFWYQFSYTVCAIKQYSMWADQKRRACKQCNLEEIRSKSVKEDGIEMTNLW